MRKEIVAILVSSVYAFAFTYGMLWAINKVTPVRTTEMEEGELDASLRGESGVRAAVVGSAGGSPTVEAAPGPLTSRSR